MGEKKNNSFWKGLGILGGVVGALIGTWYVVERNRSEPPQIYYSMRFKDKIIEALLNKGFRKLNPLKEVYKKKELWGLSLKLNKKQELHIRAIESSSDELFLTAHIEYARESLAHLTNEANYEAGEQMLINILKELDLYKYHK